MTAPDLLPRRPEPRRPPQPPTRPPREPRAPTTPKPSHPKPTPQPAPRPSKNWVGLLLGLANTVVVVGLFLLAAGLGAR